MPIVRTCKTCGRQNRIPAEHLADTGRCGACKSTLSPLAEPLEVDSRLFDEIVEKARVPVLVREPSYSRSTLSGIRTWLPGSTCAAFQTSPFFTAVTSSSSRRG
jgi:hypothetical protein